MSIKTKMLNNFNDIKFTSKLGILVNNRLLINNVHKFDELMKLSRSSNEFQKQSFKMWIGTPLIS